MTRRDFELIAGVLRETNATPEQAQAFASALAATNPRFDRERFLSACQP